ncbi:hypothetical protein TeGR_g44 [Tetraparma gracilis]|uniref:Uncharacterized protein n=1 Tax=Tetraparma gracilis TaxID=2962635 RepID=A0ABQ6N712_9STRA|nr:hypothetical protein TeGR_g44 [Tetraparma gracilis]
MTVSLCASRHNSFYSASKSRVLTRLLLSLLGLGSIALLIYILTAPGGSGALGPVALPVINASDAIRLELGAYLGVYATANYATLPAPYISPPLFPWGAFLVGTSRAEYPSLIVLRNNTPSALLKFGKGAPGKFRYTARCGLFLPPADFEERCPRSKNRCMIDTSGIEPDNWARWLPVPGDVYVVPAANVFAVSPMPTPESPIMQNSFNYTWRQEQPTNVTGFCQGYGIQGDSFLNGTLELVLDNSVEWGLGFLILVSACGVLFLGLGIFIC